MYVDDSNIDPAKDEFRLYEKAIKQYCKTCLAATEKFSKIDAPNLAFDWSHVVDVRRGSQYLSESFVDDVVTGSDKGSHKRRKVIKGGGLPEGFYIIPGALSPELQLSWAKISLQEYSTVEHTNLTNLSAINDNSTHHSDATQSSCSSNLPGVWANVPSSGQHRFQNFLKLRWSCLGYHYDWTARMYQKNLKSNFPPDLAALCQSIARQAAGCPASSSTPFVPEAAIVNYYPLGASMGGHLDDAEHTMEQPIVSLSLGCSAIFLIGGRDRRTRPVPVLLRSGDAVVMSGESRYCYHGVPCILPVNFTPLTSVDGADGEDEGNQDGPCPADFARSVSSVADLYGLCTEGDAAARRVVDFLCEARININVRQVRVNPALEHVWVEKAGTGGQKVAPTAAANGTD